VISRVPGTHRLDEKFVKNFRRGNLKGRIFVRHRRRGDDNIKMDSENRLQVADYIQMVHDIFQ
jgi:hypothetical protein